MRTRLRLPEEQRIVVYTGWAGTLQATPPNRQLETMAQSRAWRKVEIEAVIDHDRAGVIATLERVRAQLEAEQADADGTVRKPWQLISEAIDHLRGINSRAQDDRSETEAPKQADDLTSIRGVSPALAEHLASLGVTRYAQITAWRADDVRNVAQALGLTREISRQNWIEQAAMLEHRKANGDNEVTADRAASMPEAGGGVAPAAHRTIDLQFSKRYAATSLCTNRHRRRPRSSSFHRSCVSRQMQMKKPSRLPPLRRRLPLPRRTPKRHMPNPSQQRQDLPAHKARGYPQSRLRPMSAPSPRSG